MKLRITLLVLLFSMSANGAFPWTAAPAEDAQKGRETELARLKEALQSARDSLQNEITGRYTMKQRGVEQREADKDEMDLLREQQERTLNDLSRLKEECLARQQTLDDERKTTTQKIDEWGYVKSAVGDLLDREAGIAAEAFPLDRDGRAQQAAVILQTYRRNSEPGVSWSGFVSYRMAFFAEADTVSLVKRTVLPDDGEAQSLTIARFGSVSGYGINPQGVFYMVRQTGTLGAGKYAIDKVGSPEVTAFLQKAFPAWLSAARPAGAVLTDVMQNDFTKTLISGKKVNKWAALAKWFKDGGPVMFPLLLVALWALLLWGLKLRDFGSERRLGAQVHGRITALLAQQKREEARASAAEAKGLFARIALFCLSNAAGTRESSERAIKEILIGESPRLSRHINTLAVLATAAPLLGLLGTVTGMINLFAVLTQYGNSDPKLVAGGISEALVTTQTGMMIAIPIVLIHNYLRNRRNVIQTELEKYSISLLNKLWP